MITSGKTSDLTQVLILHPFILCQLADSRTAVVALHGRTASNRCTNFALVQAVERTVRTVNAAGRSRGRRGLLGTLSRAQGSRNVERALEGTKLLRLKRQVLIARRGRRVICGRGLGRIDRRGMAVDGDLLASESRGSSSRSHNVGSHLR